MDIIELIILAVVEGLTEFLPISSTGHLIITQHFLNIENSDFIKVFLVNIQFGAILAVVWLYFKKFIRTFGFYITLFVAFLPAAVIGLLLNDYIDQLLENVWVVACSLLIGGVFMLFIDRWFAKNERKGLQKDKEQPISFKMALWIGLWQCLAMVPGVSRSMATIVGGLSQKLTRKNATEFSFFLAVPTIAAAAGYKLLKQYTAVTAVDNALLYLLLGNIISFVVAILAIKLFISILQRYGFRFFGWYRICLGSLMLVLLFAGTKLALI